jgi:hypothetical protein
MEHTAETRSHNMAESRWRRVAVAVLASASVVACAPQAPTDYQGESLMHLEGRVEFASEPLSRFDTDRLQPALAFFVPERGELRIVDVAAEGEFPNRFALDIYDVPPEDTLSPVDPEYGSGRIAFAYVTAVAPDHTESISLVTKTRSATIMREPCPAADDCSACAANGCIDVHYSTCSGRGPERQCYEEFFRCPDWEVPDEQCQSTKVQGDPGIVGRPWSELAGLSQNYMLLYVEEEIVATKGLERNLGVESFTFSPGYHVVEVERGADGLVWTPVTGRDRETLSVRLGPDVIPVLAL